MESMGELHDQPGLADSGVGTPTSADLMSPDLSPTISRTGGLAVSVSSMIDSNEFRSQMPESATYQTLNTVNGHMSPTGTYQTSSFATLTPLQPLPPISTVSDKFSRDSHTPNVSGSFTLMQNNGYPIQTSMAMDINYRDSKLGGMAGMNMGPSLGATSPMSMMSGNGYTNYNLGVDNYTQYTKTEPRVMSPNGYEYRSVLAPQPGRLHSPNPMMPINGLHNPLSPQLSSPRDRVQTSMDSSSKHEVEEINTKELAQKISSELKRYSIPQAVFAQRVLCRSQGTLSDLLRNPKPWSKLKSGRETFRRMWKWLQEPEFQRMSALRLAGRV